MTDMRDIDSNSVYVASLGHHKPQGWEYDFVDVVSKLGRYFFPANGKNWPKVPPNYIAFPLLWEAPVDPPRRWLRHHDSDVGIAARAANALGSALPPDTRTGHTAAPSDADRIAYPPRRSRLGRHRPASDLNYDLRGANAHGAAPPRLARQASKPTRS